MKIEVLQKVAEMLDERIKAHQAEIIELEEKIIKLEQKLDNLIAEYNNNPQDSVANKQASVQSELHESEEEVGNLQHDLYAITEERVKYEKAINYCKDMESQSAKIDEQKVLEALEISSIEYLEKLIEGQA